MATTAGPRVRYVSFSELDAWRQCPHMWDLSYQQRWTPPTASPALTRGTLFHAVMADHYSKPKSKRKASASWFYDETGAQTEEQELVEWMYNGYVENYRAEDGRMKVVAVEQRLDHEIPGSGGARLTGIIDLIVRDEHGKLWLWDHKTGKDLPSDRNIELLDQMPFYLWLLRSMGKDVAGVVYNAVRTYRFKDESKQRLEDRFRRIPLHFPQKHLDQVVKDALTSLERLEHSRKTKKLERNTAEHCVRRCSFTESCLASRKGINEESFMLSKGYVRRKD